MAKIDSLIHFSGTLQGLTRVKSKLYKDHVRVARQKGTPVNKAFQQSGKEIVRANGPAKLIKDAIDPYRLDFKCGRFWSRLVSLFKEQSKPGGDFDFHALEGMEVGVEYPLSRFLNCWRVEVRPLLKNLRIIIHHDRPLFKEKLPYLDGYRLSLICIYLNKKQNKAESTLILTGPITSLDEVTEEGGKISFRARMPSDAASVIFCLRGEGTENQRILSAPNTRGMQFVKVWRKVDRQMKERGVGVSVK